MNAVAGPAKDLARAPRGHVPPVARRPKPLKACGPNAPSCCGKGPPVRPINWSPHAN